MTLQFRAQCSFGHARDRATAEEGRQMQMATKLKRWTLDEVHRLPDDGNKYELVRGDLFVTPPPTDDHETIAARLAKALTPYVEAQRLGLVYRPRAVLRFEDSEVEPDLMVRQTSPRKHTAWEHAPRPILIVEIFSDSTRRRDMTDKRQLYADAHIAEYWMVDPDRRAVTVVQPGHSDRVVSGLLAWSPAGATAPFEITLDELFA
jgi:Uma2 family endonuclease